MTSAAPRSPLQITLSVWRALVLREALTRIATGRAGWVWLLLEPVAHVALMLVIFTAMRGRVHTGVDFALFLAIGVIGYTFFTVSAQRPAAAINANRGLLSYRQVKPVDPVLARAMLEGLIQVFVTMVLLCGAAVVGFDVLPHDPLTFIEAYALLWLLGTGFGLALSVGSTIVPEIGKVMGFVFMPLYFASGVLFSPAALPPSVQSWLLYNPLIHGVELARSAFFPGYHLVQGVSMGYLAGFALGFVLFGLALHRRFAAKLMSQ